METVAIYTEDVIRIYGITRQPGQALLTIRIPQEDINTFYESISSHHPFPFPPFTYCSLASSENGLSSFLYLLACENLQPFLLFFAELQKKHSDWTCTATEPVEALFLHGPHFHDRYGIAEAILSVIKNGGIEIVLASCCGTSMYIVTVPEQAEECSRLLKESFPVPTSP